MEEDRVGLDHSAAYCRTAASAIPTMFNTTDQKLWNGLFAEVPPEWKTAPPSAAMMACRDVLRRERVRKVWDVGCGVGRWSIFLARAGFEVKGSDFAPNGVRYAAEWAREEGLDVELACCPLTDRPFPDTEFDAVVAALVLDNVRRDEMDRAIAHIHAGLRDDGLVFTVFNPEFTEEDLERLAASDNPTRGITSVVYRDAEIREAFRGFELLERMAYEQGTRGFLFRKVRTARPLP